ncbi:tetratricopeptide repeat protein [Acidobacteria bacterium AH-259-O06]|nr:tetratricopeptide repeat protein [Acidobacteria bacterium AH-259-O06]
MAGSLRDCQRAIELDPELPQAHFQAAQILARLGEHEKAQEEIAIYEELKGKVKEKEFRVFTP